MNRFIATTLVIGLALCSLAQTSFTQTVKGKVIDKESLQALQGVVVVIVDDGVKKGAVTDEFGFFTISDVSVGRQTANFTYIGYKPEEVSQFLVNSSKEVQLNIEMTETLEEMKEVTIRAKMDRRSAENKMASLSARTMSMDETQKYSGSLGDVSRMAQNFAGVSGASDDRNDIIVRGNSPVGVLWRMEGVDIPSPNHWSTFGATGGPVSMLNPNNLKNSDFLTGAYPAEYGNGTSAVFDLKLRNGNQDKHEFLGQIGFNGFEAGAEGPLKIGNRSSYLVNYRYSTLGVINALGFDFGTGAAVPQFQDISFKVNMPFKKSTFSIWGLGGTSAIEFLAEAESANLFSESGENLRSGSRTGILGFRHSYFFNNTTSSKLSVAVSRAENYANIERILDTATTDFKDVFRGDRDQEKVSAHWSLNKKWNAKNRLKVGVLTDYTTSRLSDSFLVGDTFWYRQVDFEGSSNLYRAYCQWQHKFNSKLTLNAGVHYMLLELNKSQSVEPRIGLTYKPKPRVTFALAYGRHGQMQPLPIYFSKDNNATDAENEMNKELDFYQSDQFVFSTDILLTSKVRLKFETYYQDLSGIAVDPSDGAFSVINSGSDFVFENRVGLVNQGQGANKGVELTLERFLGDGFYFLGTASLFDSKYKGSDLVERNTYFNSNYVFNVLGGKEFVLSEKVTLTLDGRFSYARGRRYTPIDLANSNAQGHQVLDMTQYFEGQFDPYLRPDIKFGIRHNAKNYSQVFSVDLQNFIGRDNVFSQGYDAEQGEITTIYQRGFFPDVRYQIFF